MSENFEETLHAILEATEQRDLDKLLSLISIDEDAIMILPNGALFRGRAAVTNLHSAWFADPDWQSTPTILRTVATDHMAYAFILSHFRDSSLDYDKQHYLSLVFARDQDSDKWRLILHQNTIAQ